MHCPIVTSFLLAIALFAPRIAGQSSLSYGVLQRSCAPWDGPAIEMRLSSEAAQCKNISGPYVEIGIWRELPLHGGQIVKFGPNANAGFASRCAKVGDCERAESATVLFETYAPGSRATGRYQLHFKGGKDMKGDFDVKWCESHLLCR